MATHLYQAWAWSNDGKDRFTTEYPAENLLKKTRFEYTRNSEFINHPDWDMSPVFDEYGIDKEYTVSFDIKSAIAGPIRVYAQSGSGTEYGIGAETVPATTEYSRQKRTFKPTLQATPGYTTSLLAFYGVYNSGRIPTVKNVKLEMGKGTIDTPSSGEDLENSRPKYLGTCYIDSDVQPTDPSAYTWTLYDYEEGVDRMATISSGQITIVDLYDAPALNAWISASTTTTQTYNNQTQVYSPNYASSPQVLTLNLTKAGSTESLIGSAVGNVKWYKIVGADQTEITSTTATDTDYKGGTANTVLTTKTNIPTENNAIKWRVEGTYVDPDTDLPIVFQADINLQLVQLAKASVIAVVSTPSGDFFRNGAPASLKITADVYKDGTITATSRKYKWFAADSSITTSQDPDAGVGWRKITATSGTAGAIANSAFDAAVTTQGVLTVYPDAVLNGQTFLVVITDNAGGTSGTKMKQYATLKDMDDPIMTVVESTGGNILKNGAGSTTLTARLYRNGGEVDTDGTTYNYRWSKWQDNVMVPTFGGTGNPYKTGKTLAVGSADVQNSTTFKVEVMTK